MSLFRFIIVSFYLFLNTMIPLGKLYSQSCLPSGITFTTQAKVDVFPKNYLGCSSLLLKD